MTSFTVGTSGSKRATIRQDTLTSLDNGFDVTKLIGRLNCRTAREIHIKWCVAHFSATTNLFHKCGRGMLSQSSDNAESASIGNCGCKFGIANEVCAILNDGVSNGKQFSDSCLHKSVKKTFPWSCRRCTRHQFILTAAHCQSIRVNLRLAVRCQAAPAIPPCGPCPWRSWAAWRRAGSRAPCKPPCVPGTRPAACRR